MRLRIFCVADIFDSFLIENTSGVPLKRCVKVFHALKKQQQRSLLLLFCFFYTLQTFYRCEWKVSKGKADRGLQHFCVQKQNTLLLRTKGTKPKTICSQRKCPVRVLTLTPSDKHGTQMFYLFFRLSIQTGKYGFFLCLLLSSKIKLHIDLRVFYYPKKNLWTVERSVLTQDLLHHLSLVRVLDWHREDDSGRALSNSFATSYPKLCHTVECQQCAKYRVQETEIHERQRIISFCRFKKIILNKLNEKRTLK